MKIFCEPLWNKGFSSYRSYGMACFIGFLVPRGWTSWKTSFVSLSLIKLLCFSCVFQTIGFKMTGHSVHNFFLFLCLQNHVFQRDPRNDTDTIGDVVHKFVSSDSRVATWYNGLDILTGLGIIGPAKIAQPSVISFFVNMFFVIQWKPMA